MNKISKLLIASAFLGLSACGGNGDDAAADNVEAAYENKADQLDAMADNSSGAAADALETKADQVEELGEQKADAIDDADVNTQVTNVEAAEGAAVNGM